MNIIIYTKTFSYEKEFLARNAHRKYDNKINNLTLKQEDNLLSGKINEFGGPLRRLLARRKYRKADKLQRKIDKYKALATRFD